MKTFYLIHLIILLSILIIYIMFTMQYYKKFDFYKITIHEEPVLDGGKAYIKVDKKKEPDKVSVYYLFFSLFIVIYYIESIIQLIKKIKE